MNNKTKLDIFLSKAYSNLDKYVPYWGLISLIFMITIGQFWEHSILIQILILLLLLSPLFCLAILLLDLINWLYKKVRFR